MAVDIIMIIVLGMVLMTGMVGLFDYLGKRAQAGAPKLQGRIEDLERRLAAQEQAALEREETVRKLQGELSFMTNLLESKTR